ncbi:MAG TPA: GNAT family N-acetyltransferase [Sporichthya sp.]|nr:GNAT family N-acetyltransferase [Sporichthya sp.]
MITPDPHAPPELPPEPIEIAAGTLQLRPWEHRLIPELLTAMGDPVYLEWAVAAVPTTEAEAGAWVDARLKAWRDGRVLSFAVQDATTAELLGSVTLRSFGIWPRGADIGYWTAPAARQRGVAVASVNVITRWAFHSLELNRLTLFHAVQNTGACQVAAAAGYLREGVARGALPRAQGGWFDMEMHARLAGDPAPRPSAPSA